MSPPADADVGSASLFERLRFAFLLQGVRRLVSGRSLEQQRVIRRLFDAAEIRETAAHEMFDRANVMVGLELGGAAAALYLSALLASEFPPGEALRLDRHESWTRFDQLLRDRAWPRPPATFDAARTLLAGRDTPVGHQVSRDEARALAKVIRPTLRWLKHLIEPRTITDLKHQRLRRTGAVALAILAPFAWAINAYLIPHNVALHCPVAQSSRHPASTAPEGGLVDGIIEQPYGIHTSDDDKPFVTVDLGRSYKIDRIVAYNRGDAYFDVHLPLTFELAEDPSHFVEVDKRTTSFSQAEPWVFAAKRRSARYVRVGGKPGGSIALAELEVYARTPF